MKHSKFVCAVLAVGILAMVVLAALLTGCGDWSSGSPTPTPVARDCRLVATGEVIRHADGGVTISGGTYKCAQPGAPAEWQTPTVEPDATPFIFPRSN